MASRLKKQAMLMHHRSLGPAQFGMLLGTINNSDTGPPKADVRRRVKSMPDLFSWETYSDLGEADVSSWNIQDSVPDEKKAEAESKEKKRPKDKGQKHSSNRSSLKTRRHSAKDHPTNRKSSRKGHKVLSGSSSPQKKTFRSVELKGMIRIPEILKDGGKYNSAPSPKSLDGEASLKLNLSFVTSGNLDFADEGVADASIRRVFSDRDTEPEKGEDVEESMPVLNGRQSISVDRNKRQRNRRSLSIDEGMRRIVWNKEGDTPNKETEFTDLIAPRVHDEFARVKLQNTAYERSMMKVEKIMLKKGHKKWGTTSRQFTKTLKKEIEDLLVSSEPCLPHWTHEVKYMIQGNESMSFSVDKNSDSPSIEAKGIKKSGEYQEKSERSHRMRLHLRSISGSHPHNRTRSSEEISENPPTGETKSNEGDVSPGTGGSPVAIPVPSPASRELISPVYSATTSPRFMTFSDMLNLDSLTSTDFPRADDYPNGVTMEGYILLAVRCVDNLAFSLQFLCCYRNFLSPKELMNILIQFYSNPPTQTQDFIKISVIKFLMRWIHTRIVDFTDDDEESSEQSNEDQRHGKLSSGIDKEKEGASALMLLNEFISTQLGDKTEWMEALSQLWLDAVTELAAEENLPSFWPDSPSPILTEKMKALPPVTIVSTSDYQAMSVYAFSPVELARQRTIIDHELFSAIPITELMHTNFMKPERSIHVQKMQHSFENFTKWIGTEVCTCPNIKQRIKTLQVFILMAEEFQRLHNWQGLIAVTSGLSQFAVSRMAQTWKGLSRDIASRWKALEDFATPLGNFRNMRESHYKSSLPAVLSNAIYLKDLTYIEEGNSDYVSPSTSPNDSPRSDVSINSVPPSSTTSPRLIGDIATPSPDRPLSPKSMSVPVLSSGNLAAQGNIQEGDNANGDSGTPVEFSKISLSGSKSSSLLVGNSQKANNDHGHPKVTRKKSILKYHTPNSEGSESGSSGVSSSKWKGKFKKMGKRPGSREKEKDLKDKRKVKDKKGKEKRESKKKDATKTRDASNNMEETEVIDAEKPINENGVQKQTEMCVQMEGRERHATASEEKTSLVDNNIPEEEDTDLKKDSYTEEDGENHGTMNDDEVNEVKELVNEVILEKVVEVEEIEKDVLTDSLVDVSETKVVSGVSENNSEMVNENVVCEEESLENVKKYNLSKMEMLGKTLSSVYIRQRTPYKLNRVPHVLGFLENVFFLDDVEHLEIHSTKIEPSSGEV